MAKNGALSPRTKVPDRSGLKPHIRKLLSEFEAQYPSIQLTSAYRSPAYNRKVGGASKSQHTHGNALDFSLRGLSDDQKTAVLQWWRARGAKGLGQYPKSDSIHVDFRSTPAAWGPNYRSSSLGQTDPWFQAAIGRDVKLASAQAVAQTEHRAQSRPDTAPLRSEPAQASAPIPPMLGEFMQAYGLNDRPSLNPKQGFGQGLLGMLGRSGGPPRLQPMQSAPVQPMPAPRARPQQNNAQQQLAALQALNPYGFGASMYSPV